MIRYLAFFRGINIGGKNRLPMAELKLQFERLDFAEVKTYLNSGNVAFYSIREDKEQIGSQLELMVKESFGLDIPVYVITKDELENVLRHAPDWWGTEDKEIYDNLIFILPPAAVSEVVSEIGPPKDGLEKIQAYKETIFWSFRRKDYQKTNWWPKTASANISNMLTIRTAGTVRRICGL